MIPNVKDFSKLIGMGVAIQCSDDFVRKFKVLAVRVYYEGSGQRVSGIAVDAPRQQCEYWRRVGWMVQDGGWWWLHPTFAFRSKGECLRHDAAEAVAQSERNIERYHNQIDEHQLALDTLKQLLQKEVEKKNGYLKSLKKWSKK